MPTAMLGDAFDALELRAELVVIHHVRQAADAAFERLLAILVVEELGVGQPGAHHARVAGDDRLRIAGVEVRHEQEAIEQRAAAHRAAQSTSGSAASSGSGTPAAPRGIPARSPTRRPSATRPAPSLHRAGPRGATTVARRCAPPRVQLLLDALTPRRERRHDLALELHLLDVGVGRMDHHLALAHEAMSERLGAGQVRPSACTGTTSCPCIATSRCAGRTNCTVVTAVGELVAHHLGDRQPRDGLVERGLQRHVQASVPPVTPCRNTASALPSFSTTSESGPCCRADRHLRKMTAPDPFELLQERVRPVARGVACDGKRHQLLLEGLVCRAPPDTA